MIRFRAVKKIVWVILALGLHVWPRMVGTAHGQGSRKDDIVFNSRGVPLAGATVRVCAMPATGQPCTPLAQIYSDAALTQAMANPTTTDGLGNYSFYAAPGKYELEISGPGITTKQLPNVIFPSDPSSPTFNSLSTTGGINAFTLNLSGNLTVNGSTTVVGNLASGTLTLNNQGSSPGTPGAGTVNLYTKSVDKRLYYKDETGAEIGPISSASGAQTNVANVFTAPQSIDSDFHTKGPNPSWDVTRFGGYIGPNYTTPTTGSISSGSATLSIASAMDFANGQGVLVLGAGPAPVIATPQAPTVTPISQTGSTSYSYCVVDTDWFGGRTPCSGVGSTSTGASSIAFKSYTVSGWSTTNGVVTVTTSSPHNIPTTAYNFGYPQFEVQQGTTNSAYCEGAWTATAIPSTTTIQFTRYGVPDSTMNACSGGTLRVLPEVVLKWDSHYTYSVTNAACSGGTATLTISPGVYGPNNTWVVPWFVKAIIAGVSDSHYNTTATVGQWTGPLNNTLQYGIVGGSCSGVSTGNLGGTVSLVPGKAVKNHLIYRCTGASCALPANAGNYSLVGVAIGNDGYFVDIGVSPGTNSIDLGDAPATPPSTATNDYLSTTIANGGGTTTLTLAANAATTVSGAKVFHDNTPNVLAACAAIPSGSGQFNSGRILIPAPTAVGGQGGAMFPIMANLDTYGNFGAARNCPGVTLDFRGMPWLQGTIMMAAGINMVSDMGATNCVSAAYGMGQSLNCAYGYAYPMLYFEPEQSHQNFLQNFAFAANQPYQAALFYDSQLNGDGVVGQQYENVHTSGGSASFPIVDKGGFGRFWNYGGWSLNAADYAHGRSYTFTINCGAPTYQLQSAAMGTYLTETHGTYNFGTAVVDGCGQTPGNWQNATFNNMLTENEYGPAWLFNTYPYGPSAVTFNNSSYSDPRGGYATPFYDLTNASGGARWKDAECGTGFQTLLETRATGNGGIVVEAANASLCSFIGAPSYRYDNQTNNLSVENNYNRQLNGSSQVYTPLGMPANFQSVTQGGAGNVPAGTYTYCLTASDAFGGETALTPSACTNVTVTGSPSVVNFTLPASFPSGATGVNLYINGYQANANGCVKPEYTQPGSAQVYNFSFTCGIVGPSITTAMANGVNSTAVAAAKLMLNGEYMSSATRSEQNIFLPGALTSTWTGSTWTPDRAVTVTRLQVQMKTAPAGCTTNAIVRLTDGTTPVNVTVSAAANDSGAIAQNYAAGSTLTIGVQTAAAGCATSPADGNVTVQYRMQ